MNNLESFITGSLTTSFILWWAACWMDYIVNPLIQVLGAGMIIIAMVLLFIGDKKKVKRK